VHRYLQRFRFSLDNAIIGEHEQQSYRHNHKVDAPISTMACSKHAIQQNSLTNTHTRPHRLDPGLPSKVSGALCSFSTYLVRSSPIAEHKLCSSKYHPPLGRKQLTSRWKCLRLGHRPPPSLHNSGCQNKVSSTQMGPVSDTRTRLGHDKMNRWRPRLKASCSLPFGDTCISVAVKR
jgi:hypothetical protein